MPSYAAAGGIIGGVIALAALIWTIWNQNHPQVENDSQHSFNPGPGYDRPRDSWTNEDSDNSQRRRRGRAECAICRDSLTQQSIRRLPCSHIFHDSCITQWFRQSRTCPTCRNPA